MAATEEVHAALAVLARYIEQEAESFWAEDGAECYLEKMAAERGTAPDYLCRGLPIQYVIHLLIQHLNWPDITKFMCQEVMLTETQNDIAWFAKARRRRAEEHAHRCYMLTTERLGWPAGTIVFDASISDDGRCSQANHETGGEHVFVCVDAKLHPLRPGNRKDRSPNFIVAVDDLMFIAQDPI